MWLNGLCTLVEASGLILVVAVGISYWGSVDYLETPAVPGDDSAVLLVIQGGILTFFAFIGFEDMYNVAEEVREPQRTIPLGLITAMAIAAVLYIGVAITSVSVVPWQELAEAPGPITEVVSRAVPFIPPVLFTGITLFAVANTGLVNFVTASRLLYGMAGQGLLPSILGQVHAGRRTPHVAIAALFLILVPLALSGTVSELASATVLLLLAVFTVVNGSLFILKGRKGEAPGQFEIPRLVPALGALVCLGLIVVRISTGDWRAPLIASALLLACFVIYVAMRGHALPAGRTVEQDD
jgi:APA family basic amino acid/polyamine antiporter